MAEDMHRWFQAGLESPATNAAAGATGYTDAYGNAWAIN